VDAATRRQFWIVGAAAVAVAVVLPMTARVVADRYHDDTLWRNTLASVGGTQKPGDFGYVFLPAGDAVLSGRSPYMNPGDYQGRPQAPYAYPPVLAFLVAPLSVLPERVGGSFFPGVLFSLVLILSVVAALLLFDIRDWRCYLLTFVSPVTLEAIEYGAIGSILLLLVALAWRYRDRKWAVSGAVGGAIVLKLFVWPLFLWLVFTRRIRSAFLAAGIAIALALASWTIIEFRGLADYPRLLRRLVEVEAEHSYSVFAMLRTAGLSDPAARMVVVACGLVLLAVAWRAARSRNLNSLERDRRSLLLVIAVAILLTPILWLHYLILLFAPIALARPQLSLLWFAPLTLTIFEGLDWYRGWPNGDWKALLSVAVIAVIVFVGALWPSQPPAISGRSAPGPATREPPD
jgi:alpha-1,2-mannosyltransferase